MPLDRLQVLSGTTAHFDVTAESGRINSRHFCPNCGTRVWAVLEEMGFASVNGLALDDRSHFRPEANHMPDRAPNWCVLGELPSA